MKTKIATIFSLLFTMFFLFLILWNRFLRTHIAKDIFYEDHITYSSMIICCLFMISFILYIYYLAKVIKKAKPNSTINKLKIKIITFMSKTPGFNLITIFIQENIIKGPQNVYEIIYKYVYIKPYIQFVAQFLIKNFQDNFLTFYIITMVLPRIIPLLILFREITYYNHIEYFYNSLIILLIPLFAKITIYIIKHHAIQSLDFYDTYFDFTLVDDTLHVYYKHITDPDSKKEQELYSKKAGYDWELFQAQYNFCYQVDLKKETYSSLSNVIIYFLSSLDFFLCLLIILGFL